MLFFYLYVVNPSSELDGLRLTVSMRLSTHITVVIACLCCPTVKPISFVRAIKDQQMLYSNSKAGQICEDKGLTLSGEEVFNGNQTIGLEVGETAWLSGYAILSPFVSWHGCRASGFRTGHTEWSSVLKAGNNIAKCSRSCDSKGLNIRYIALHKEACHCLNSSDHFNRPVADAICNETCDPLLDDTCGGANGEMSVYKIERQVDTRLDVNYRNKACVYIRRTTESWRKDSLRTAFCHTITGLNLPGFICSDSLSRQLNTTSPSNQCKKVRTINTCYFNDTIHVTTCAQARQDCLSLSGKLSGDLGGDFSIMPKNKNFWIGFFRGFQYYWGDRTRREDAVCLAVTNVGDSLKLGFANCSEDLRTLCSDSQKRVTGGIDSGTTTPKGTQSLTAEDNGDTNAGLVASVVALVGLVVVVIAIGCFLFRRRARRQIAGRQVNTDRQNLYEDTSKLDSTEIKEEKVQRDVNIGSKLRVGTENSITPKRTPSKPIRRTLKLKQSRKTAYENVHLKNAERVQKVGRTQVRRPTKDDDYDKVNLKAAPRFVPCENGEIHIYDHTVFGGNDNYDTMTSVKSVHVYGCPDDAYNRVVILRDENSSKQATHSKPCRGSTRGSQSSTDDGCSADAEDSTSLETMEEAVQDASIPLGINNTGYHIMENKENVNTINPIASDDVIKSEMNSEDPVQELEEAEKRSPSGRENTSDSSSTR